MIINNSRTHKKSHRTKATLDRSCTMAFKFCIVFLRSLFDSGRVLHGQFSATELQSPMLQRLEKAYRFQLQKACCATLQNGLSRHSWIGPVHSSSALC